MLKEVVFNYPLIATPDLGGTYKPDFNLNNTIVISRPPERITPIQKPQEIQIIYGLGEHSRLEGTGFHLGLEIKRLFNNYNQNLHEGKIKEEAWALSVGELEVNLRTFVVEFVHTKTVLPHVNRIKEVNKINRMVGNNGMPVVDSITEQERIGGVKEASVRVDEFISAKIPNRVAVINSPIGESGFTKKSGSRITYKDNQSMVFWTDDMGGLHGLTIVTDLNEDQSRQLSIELGVGPELLTGQTQLEKVSNIVRNPALLSYAESLKNPAEYVLDKIIAIRGNSDFKLVQEDGSIEYRSIKQTRKDIKRVNQLLNFDQQIEDYIAELKNSLMRKINYLNDPNIQIEIARQMEEVVLNIAVDHLQKTPNKYYVLSTTNNFIPALTLDQDKFKVAAAFLRTRAGCSSGGSVLRALKGLSLDSEVMNAQMPASVSMEDLIDPDFCIRCGACGKFIWKKVGKGESCPKCDLARQC